MCLTSVPDWEKWHKAVFFSNRYHAVPKISCNKIHGHLCVAARLHHTSIYCMFSLRFYFPPWREVQYYEVLLLRHRNNEWIEGHDFYWCSTVKRCQTARTSSRSSLIFHLIVQGSCLKSEFSPIHPEELQSESFSAGRSRTKPTSIF